MWGKDEHLKKHFFHFLGDAHGAKVVIGRMGEKRRKKKKESQFQKRREKSIFGEKMEEKRENGKRKRENFHK